MPRDGSGVYTKPYPNVAPNTTIASTVFNGNTADVETDLNAPRPVIAGGTGGNSADAALANLAAEKGWQVVTNYSSHVFYPGSFYSSTATGQGAPVDGHAFVGAAYVSDAKPVPPAAPANQNLVIEARDQSDTVVPGRLYVREKKAGVWGAWTLSDSSIFAAPLDVLAYSGMQINGSFEVAQEFGGALKAITTAGTPLCDVWHCSLPASASWAINIQQFTGPFGGYNFKNSLSLSVGTAGSVAASDSMLIVHPMEGNRVASLMFGSTQARSVTVCFWIFSTVAGVIGVSLRNGATNRSCVQAVSVGTGAWEYKTVTFPGDTTGTWLKDTGAGMLFTITPACGTNFRTATLGAWQAGNLVAPNTMGNLLTAGAGILLANVMIIPGSQAPPSDRQIYISRNFETELVAVKRVWQKTYPYAVIPGAVAANTGIIDAAGSAAPSRPFLQWRFPVNMRASPTAIGWSPTTGAVGNVRNLNTNTDVAYTVFSTDETQFTVHPNGTPAAGDGFAVHMAANARLL